MGLSSSMNAGVMGLSVNSSKLATISDNIANSETKGYKRASIDFNSLVLTERPTAYDAGGVRASTIREIDDQGALLSTRNSTDLAISGNGFLPVTDIADVERGADTLPLKLLRTGAFRPDQNGVMQTQAGLALLGWKSTPDGGFSNLASALEPVQIDTLSLAAEPTQAVDVKVNLNADSDPTLDPPHMSRIEYFDTLGKSRNVDLWFQKTGTDHLWSMSVYEEGYATDADSGEPTERPSLAFLLEFETDLSKSPGGIKSVVEMDQTALAAERTAGLTTGAVSFDETVIHANAGGELLNPATDAVYVSGGANVTAATVAGRNIAGNYIDATGAEIIDDATGEAIPAALASVAAPASAATTTDIADPIIETSTGTDPQGNPIYGPDGANRTWKWDAIPGDAERGILSFAFNGGEEIDITLGARGSDENITQFAADESQTLSITKDGSPTSTLTGIEIDETGLMDAIYDTGFRKTLYKIPIANVQNPNGMRTQDGQAFSLTRESGSVYFYDAGEGPTGALVSSALEESTTDVAEELTQLIKTQRAYSSNAKIIQTVDEMLQETTNLKR